jgi:hypothetical protein
MGPDGPKKDTTRPSGELGWGLAPRLLPEEPRLSSRRGTLVVAAVMFGWLLVVYGMGAVVARNDPNVETPIEVNLGVVVLPADGWYSAADAWNVGENGVALQKAGVYVAFWVESFGGDNAALMTAVLDDLKPDFDSFRSLPAVRVTVAGDLPGLMVQFTGITDWGDEENELVVLSYRGVSMVMMAEGLAGRVARAQEDIDTMLRDLTVPR